MYRYIKCYKDVNGKDINSKINIYYTSINKFLNNRTLIKDILHTAYDLMIDNYGEDFSLSDLHSVMNNNGVRPKFIHAIANNCPNFKNMYKSLSNPNGLTCYVYACICYIIFKYALQGHPELYIGSDTEVSTIYSHCWVEYNGKIYDYDNNPHNIHIPYIMYKDDWKILDN